MTMKRFTVPNWAQSLMVQAIGLNDRDVVVRLEDDIRITLLEHKTGNEYTVNKSDGTVSVTEPQRIKDIKKSDAPTVQSQGTACIG